jgi:butyrate kinase
MIRLLPLLENQIRAIAKPKPTIVFPESSDPRILSAASHLTGLANIVLVGTTQEDVRRRIEQSNLPLKGSLKRFLGAVRFLIPSDERALCEEFHEAFFKASEGKRWAVPNEVARTLVRDPVMFSCMAVRQGYADAVLGGVAHASRDFFRPALRLLHTDKVAFEVGLFSLPDEHPSEIYQKNIVAFADVAINPDPTPQELAEIAVGSCKIVRDLIPPDILPHVNGAILSYSTRGSASGESVVRIRKAGELIPGLLEQLAALDPGYRTIRIEAELQISCAISIAAAQSKLRDALNDPDSPVGRANVLILPSLDSGNLMYHLYATRYPNADKVLMVGGMGARVLDFSRSASVEDVTLGGAGTVLRVKRRADWKGTPHPTFFPSHRVLIINPGSTSTRLVLFEGEARVLEQEVQHAATEIASCPTIQAQLPLRRAIVERFLADNGVDLATIDAFVGRGGLVRPVVSGTYTVNDAMLADLAAARYGEHASNLGAPLAHALATPRGKPAFIVDPVVTDEMDEVAHLTGLAGFPRRAVWHALSQKAVARQYADDNLSDYEDLNLVVAHLGGGISVGVHSRGRVTWVSNGLEEGPMSAERSGTLPNDVLVDLCLHRELAEKEVRRRLVGQGGLVSHLGTSDLREVERRVDAGDTKAALVWEKLCQEVAATIASCVARFAGERVDRVILTGGMTRSNRLLTHVTTLLRQIHVGVSVYPGELEGEALRDGAVRVLRAQEKPLVY